MTSSTLLAPEEQMDVDLHAPLPPAGVLNLGHAVHVPGAQLPVSSLDREKILQKIGQTLAKINPAYKPMHVHEYQSRDSPNPSYIIFFRDYLTVELLYEKYSFQNYKERTSTIYVEPIPSAFLRPTSPFVMDLVRNGFQVCRGPGSSKLSKKSIAGSLELPYHKLLTTANATRELEAMLWPMVENMTSASGQATDNDLYAFISDLANSVDKDETLAVDLYCTGMGIDDRIDVRNDSPWVVTPAGGCPAIGWQLNIVASHPPGEVSHPRVQTRSFLLNKNIAHVSLILCGLTLHRKRMECDLEFGEVDFDNQILMKRWRNDYNLHCDALVDLIIDEYLIWPKPEERVLCLRCISLPSVELFEALCCRSGCMVRKMSIVGLFIPAPTTGPFTYVADSFSFSKLEELNIAGAIRFWLFKVLLELPLSALKELRVDGRHLAEKMENEPIGLHDETRSLERVTTIGAFADDVFYHHVIVQNRRLQVLEIRHNTSIGNAVVSLLSKHRTGMWHAPLLRKLCIGDCPGIMPELMVKVLLERRGLHVVWTPSQTPRDLPMPPAGSESATTTSTPATTSLKSQGMENHEGMKSGLNADEAIEQSAGKVVVADAVNNVEVKTEEPMGWEYEEVEPVAPDVFSYGPGDLTGVLGQWLKSADEMSDCDYCHSHAYVERAESVGGL